MKYKDSATFASTVSVTGAVAPRHVTVAAPAFLPWQPSTWPEHKTVDAAFIATLKTIFEDSMLSEIRNVVDDAHERNKDLQHRGHVVAIAMMCALDTIAAYGYRGIGPMDKGAYIAKFIENHFPADYQPHAETILTLYRHCLIHSWNLFEATLHPGNDKIQLNGTLSFGLLNFLSALEAGAGDFLTKLADDGRLQKNTLDRYKDLRGRAK